MTDAEIVQHRAEEQRLCMVHRGADAAADARSMEQKLIAVSIKIPEFANNPELSFLILGRCRRCWAQVSYWFVDGDLPLYADMKWEPVNG